MYGLRENVQNRGLGHGRQDALRVATVQPAQAQSPRHLSQTRWIRQNDAAVYLDDVLRCPMPTCQLCVYGLRYDTKSRLSRRRCSYVGVAYGLRRSAFRPRHVCRKHVQRARSLSRGSGCKVLRSLCQFPGRRCPCQSGKMRLLCGNRCCVQFRIRGVPRHRQLYSPLRVRFNCMGRCIRHPRHAVDPARFCPWPHPPRFYHWHRF
ncbi:hypothetical protein EXIGLDRAFT_54392 [Exidia glandulosa HHB12029]|uniref:Uncharacterized protein n=1 Tax=Exidia glandulosa HHB12029 TaxID=1314781 RepID=A0A166ALH4_EXIGL|nr:hypothetical protein EXIGLDRAFT_54392 [Exidia glandulosa HHB12029]